MKDWILATRPKTLTASIVPIVSASALSFYHGSFDAYISVLAFLSALMIQISCNLFNDVIDFEKGADTDERIGPQRITQSGKAGISTVRRVAFATCFIAVILAIPLVFVGGFPIVLVGLLSLLFAYAYTGGPFPLAYLGIADVFVVFFFGIVAVGGVFYLQTGTLHLDILLLGLQVGLLCNILLAINNFRDMHQDRKVNKNTLAARFGERFIKNEISLLFFVPFIMCFYWYLTGRLNAALWVFVLFPASTYLCFKIIKSKPSPTLNKYLGLSSLFYLSFGMILSLALVFDK
ncbi:MAG: 1,4-dihydroxy-2-naphthoate octaprenyltransferase [Bdellovibrionales bacterium]